MKKTYLPILIAASLLASCGAGGSSSLSSTSSSTTSDSSSSSSQGSQSSSDPSSSSGQSSSSTEPSSSSSGSGSSSSSQAKNAWSDDEVALFEEKFGDGITAYIPFIGDYFYSFEFDAEYNCFSISFEGTEDDLTAIDTVLENFGYEGEIGTNGIHYSSYFYSDDGINVTSYFIDGWAFVDIYQHIYVAPTVSTTWDAASIALFDANFFEGASEHIPAYLPSLANETNTLDATYYEDYGCLSVYYANASQAELSAYLTLVTEAGYVLDDEQLYSKTIEGKGTISIDAYLDIFGEYWADYYFVASGTEAPSEGTYTINIDDIPGLAYSSTSFEAEGVKWNCVNVMKSTDSNKPYIQMKKLKDGITSYITNASALAPLSKLEVKQHLDNNGFDGVYSVYAGTSADSMSKLTGTDGVFEMNDATFFAIKNESGNVVYLESFSFTFAKK